MAYWSFHVVVLKRTAKKCTKSYNARAQLLFCSSNLLFSDEPVAVAVVVILNSLIISRGRQVTLKAEQSYEIYKSVFGAKTALWAEKLGCCFEYRRS